MGMVIGGDDGVIVKANRALCHMSGYTQDELIGRHVRDLTYPEDRELSSPFVKRLMVGEIPSFTLEKRYLRKDGQPFWAQATTAVVRNPDGKLALALGVVEDITERKQAEESLRLSEERFRVAFEEAPVGIIMVVGEGILARVNRAFCQMSGYTADELIGTSIHDLTYPEDRGRSKELNEQVLAGLIPGFAMENRYLTKNGGFLWVQMTATAVHDRGGNVVCGLGIIENITDRKRAEEALAKEHRNIKHMLRSSDNERQLIAYEIHDGLAQQLAGAIMRFDAYEYLRGTNPVQAAEAYHAAITMVRQGHFETRRLIARVRPPILDESGVVEAVAHLVNELRREKGPRIEFLNSVEFDRLEPTLENAIYRIAQEALTNACKHSQSKRIWVSLLQRDDRLRVEIRDWGVGFDPKAVPKGHFGLEGIRQRARLLGGKCSIRSMAGKGTRIRVELPVVLRDEEG